jgi:Zn-dependent metalloprotease
LPEIKDPFKEDVTMKIFKKTPIMQALHGLLSAIGAVAIFFSATGVQPVAAQGPAQPARPDLAQCLNGNQTKSAYNPHTGKINFVSTTAGNPVHQLSVFADSVSAEQAARGYLSDCGSFFGLTNQTAELTLMQQKPASLNRSVVKFQQAYHGIPVFGAELLVQLDKSKNIILVNGDILPEPKIDTQASIEANAAQQTALLTVAAKYKSGIDTLKVSKPELWIYNPALVQSADAPTSLVWRMEVTPVGLGPIRELVFVDAHQGSVVLNFNQVETALNDRNGTAQSAPAESGPAVTNPDLGTTSLNRRTYTAHNGGTRPGTLVCNESNPTCSGGDTDAKHAHLYGGDTYNFYSDYYGRDSLDNAGMALISTVHYSSGYCNAFWDGAQMTYGDGCSIVADDVVGHEMTHGVTAHESALNYINESGAINESFSDVWGEFVDLTNGKGTDTAASRWLMGEDTSIGAIRNMKYPTTMGDPDRMGSPKYYHGYDDNGGVHTNSGVNNKAAFLITDGATFNGYTVTGIGITKAAKIYYEAQTNILISSSNYYALYNALNQACTNLIGTSGITANDCTQVHNATLATEMNNGTPPPTPPANDAFGSPIIMNNLPYYHTQDTLGATTSGDDPAFPCFTVPSQKNNTVWYQFTPSSSGTFTAYTTGSGYDTVLGIWRGSSPGSLTSVGCNDDINPTLHNYQSRVRISVSAGQTYHIEVAGYSGGGSLTLHAEFSLPVTTPKPTAPGGTVIDRTPTYSWSKITGATRYRYQLFKGGVTVYTKTVASSVCAGATCSSTPSTVLGYSGYKWRVQAMIGGTWKTYSANKAFTIAEGNVKAGYWNGTGADFYVTPTHATINKFAARIRVNGCGSWKITYNRLMPIGNYHFSFNVSNFFGSGTFSSVSRAAGKVGFNHFPIPGCGYISGLLHWTDSWMNSSQLTPSFEKDSPFDMVEPIEQSPDDMTIEVEAINP